MRNKPKHLVESAKAAPKKFIAKLLVLCMVFSMIPAMALVASASNDTTYSIKVDVEGSGSVSIVYSLGEDTNTYETRQDTTYTVKGDAFKVTQISVQPSSGYSVNSAYYTVGTDTTPHYLNSGVNTVTVQFENSNNCSLNVYAKFVYSGTGTGGGGGGGSSATVNTSSAKNGSFTVSDKNAKAGDTVKVTPKAETGYVVDQVVVKDKNGKDVPVTQNADGTYSFVMPEKAAQPVTVDVTFKEEAPISSTGFVDVPVGAYYEDAVAWAVEMGITDGVGNNSFAPDAGCTRGQIVTFLWRAAGSPEPTSSTNPFADVNTGDYYGKAVLWAVEQGITNGTSATEFSPNDTCTRAQAVTFLHRYEKQPAAAGSSFSDVADGAYYESAVDWAVANEITNGTGNNHFSPNTTCTRAQIVTFLYRDMAE